VPLVDSVQCKIFRAKEHYDSFVAEAHRQLQGYSGRLVVEVNAATNTFSPRFEDEPVLSKRLPLIIGDCIQNIRSSLDYLVWELVLAANCQPTERHAFPICETSDAFKACVKRNRLKGLSDDVITEIEALQPYTEGKDFRAHVFWALDELCNISKHRRILLTRVKPGVARQVPGSDKSTVVTKDIAGQMDMDTELVAFIAFNERGFENAPDVSAILSWMIESVERILPNFDRFF
jgi:hypothetical protein